MAKRLGSMHDAASTGNIQLLHQLLEVNKNVDARSADWETPLYSASAAGRQDAVKILVGAGAKVNARAKKRYSPLHAAALFGHLAVLDELINSGAGLEKATIRQMTPLALAARYGHTECVRALLHCGASVMGNGGDMFGRTPLHWAIKAGHGEIVTLLLDAGADVNAVDKFGKTPVMQAVKSNRPTILQQLLSLSDADVVRANRQYLEAIHVAADRGHRQCIKILLGHRSATCVGLSPDRVTNIEQKKTPLMIAAHQGRPGTLKFLLGCGADANKQDAYRLSALDHVSTGRIHNENATSRRWRRSAVLLVRHGNVDPCLLSDWRCSWNYEDNGDQPVLRNALELAFRAGFDDLVRVAAISGAPLRSLFRLFTTRTIDLPSYAAKSVSTLDWLRRYFRSPRPLKELARRVVRTAVGTPHFEQRLGKIGLAPGTLKFLMFPELDDAPPDVYMADEEGSDDDGSVDEELDSGESGGESDTEVDMEPSVFDSDLYGDAEPFVSDNE